MSIKTLYLPAPAVAMMKGRVRLASNFALTPRSGLILLMDILGLLHIFYPF